MHQQSSFWHENNTQSAHHSVDFDINDKVLSDVIQADEVREIQSASDHRLVGRHHLGEDDVRAVTNHDDKVEDIVVCNEQHIFHTHKLNEPMLVKTTTILMYKNALYVSNSTSYFSLGFNHFYSFKTRHTTTNTQPR